MSTSGSSGSQQCQDYCCSAFLRFQDDPIHSLPQLDNKIHPLFRKENFSSTIDFPSLEQSLRLGSHLVESPALVGYINTVVYGEVRDCTGNKINISDIADDDDKFRDILPSTWERAEQEVSDEESQRRAQVVLEELAEMIDWDILEVDPEDVFTCSRAVTETNDGPVAEALLTHFPNGCRSTVSLAQEWLDALREATERANSYNQDLWDDEIEEVNTFWATEDGAEWIAYFLLLRFSMAFHLVHEVSHVLQNSTFGRYNLPWDLFYRDSKLAEAGFELEAKLCGGLLDNTPSVDADEYQNACLTGQHRKVKNLIYFQQWPSSQTRHQFDDVYDYSVSSDIPFQDYDVLWTVSMSYIRQLFDNGFWKPAHLDERSLHPAKISSWPFAWKEESQKMHPIPYSDIVNKLGHRRAHNYVQGRNLTTFGTSH